MTVSRSGGPRQSLFKSPKSSSLDKKQIEEMNVKRIEKQDAEQREATFDSLGMQNLSPKTESIQQRDEAEERAKLAACGY